MRNTTISTMISATFINLLFLKNVVALVECGKSVNSWNDIVGQKTLTFPPGTNSLLSKHLTPTILDELNGKEDSMGFKFEQAIFSGCKNTDSGIGVYAGSHNSYSAFSQLMNPIIEEYHNHKVGTPHKSNMNYEDLRTVPFLA